MANAPIINTLVSSLVCGLTVNLNEVTKFTAKGDKAKPYRTVEFPTVKDSKSGKPFMMLTEDIYSVISDLEKASVLPEGVEANEKQITNKKASIVKDSALRAVCFSGEEVEDETPSQMAVRFAEELSAFLFEEDDSEQTATDPKRKIKQISKLMLTLAGTGEIPQDLSSITASELADAYAMAVKTEATNGRYTEGVNKGTIKQVLKGKKAEPIRLVNGEPVQA
jgi:hypothetical protein